MNNAKLVLEDAKTYIKLSSNENYKERLLEVYYILKENNVNTLEEFKNSNLGIGAFTYNEITIFERLKNETYMSMLAAFSLEMKSLSNLPKDYGDQLASWGRIGKTPYREEYIKNGYITTGLTEEEKSKFIK